MNKRLLDLKRLWRDTRIALQADARISREIFTDPDEVEALAHFGLHTLDSLAPNECLFLLGRPGAGKSAEVERISEGQVPAFASEWIVLIRCKEAGVDLHPEISRDPKWLAGLRQSKPIRLVLDGLDEGFLREPAYFSRLKRTLEIIYAEHNNLRLLLTCRPAEWDADFGAAVHAVWRGTGEPAVFALEPLLQHSREALVEARCDKIDRDAFFAWIYDNHFEEFAAWPRSLEWLADEFNVGRAANLTFTELCRLRVARSFGEDKRLSAARSVERSEACAHAIMLLAATLVFCGRKGIALDNPRPDCLTLDDLFRANERVEMQGRPALTRERVRDAVQTSHLIQFQEGYYRFENQSDLEFLAGAMLASLQPEQVSELIGTPDHLGHRRVFPQLATTAANLAAQAPHFFEYLLEHDPRVLMRVDFASKSPDARSRAINAILTATAKLGATGEHDQHAHFSTLRHPHIDAQLRPWLLDSKASQVVRQLAFDIARACCGGEFWTQVEAAATAGDEFAQSKLPSLIRRFGKNWPEEKLRAWAGGGDERLAGAALDALLDRGWRIRELAPLLREPDSDFFGLYQMHLHRLERECTAEDVPALLDQIGRWPSVRATHGALRDLLFAVISRGVEALDRAHVRAALTKFLIARFEDDDWLLESAGAKCGLDDASRRRGLLLALTEDWPAESESELLSFNYPLQREDYSWVLDAVVSNKENVILAKYAASLVWQYDESLRDVLERAYTAAPAFRAQLPAADESAGIFLTLQRLREESAAKHRKRLEEFQAKHKRPSYRHEELLENALGKCRAGDLSWWTSLCYALSEPAHEHDDQRFFRNTDLKRLPGWTSANEELRTEISGFARQFLLRTELPTPEPRSIPSEFFGLTYALSLHAARIAEDAELRAAIRPVWILALLRHCGSENDSLAESLAALGAERPSIVAAAFHQEFSERWQRNEPIFSQLLSAGWCAETQKALADVLALVPLQPETYMSGLAILASYDLALAQEIAARRVAEYGEQVDDSAARRAAIAACLFVTNAMWKKAWPHLLSSRGGARQLLLEYSRWLDYHETEQRIADMPLDLVAELYGLMIELFPLADAPHHVGTFTPTAVDDAYTFRRHLQRSLEIRGAHAELSRVYSRFDETRGAWWTPISIDQAQNTAHASRREPPTPAEFIRLLSTQGGLFVTDNDSLQRAVLASLRRFEQALRPDGLLAIWEKGEPRCEDVLQGEIAAHLRREFQQRQIVVNMEATVLNEHSDIRVQAALYSVTIEVKLGHSTDRDRPLKSAMRSQLRKYLENHGETHGIYVVGWFFGATFRPNGLRDIKTVKAARHYFDDQARKLSTGKFVLAAAVIDCSWPAPIASRAGKAKLARAS